MKKATPLKEEEMKYKGNKKGRAREMRIALHLMRISHFQVRDKV